MTDGALTALRLVVVACFALALSCSKSERNEAFDGEKVNESEEKGLVPGHVHLFELVQWGAPTGGIVATKRAERDQLRLALAKAQVELMEAKIERGLLEERELKVIRVKYTADNWEKQKGKVKRPPDGKIEKTTTMAPQQPGRPAHEVPAFVVEQYQEQPPREVARTPEAARAFWEPKLAEARKALADAQTLVDEAKAAAATTAEAPGQALPPVEKTRMSFAVLPLRPRQLMFDPPRDPRGYAVDTSRAARRKAFVLASTGGVSPEPAAFSDRAALEKGVELTARTYVSGLDGTEKDFDPKDGKLVLRLVGRCPARVFQVREEIKVNPGYVISIPKSIGFAEWYELAYPNCAAEQELRTRVVDLLAGAAAKEEPAIDAEVVRLKGELGWVGQQRERVRKISR